jgi:hypothetical protein
MSPSPSTSIEIAAIICMLVVGLSHVVQPRAWVDLFIDLRQRGQAGVMLVGLLHLPLAVLIVAFHNLWTGIPAVLTVLGYAWVLKATLYLARPRVGLIGLGLVSRERAHHFVYGGSVLIGLAVLLAYPHFIS